MYIISMRCTEHGLLLIPLKLWSTGELGLVLCMEQVMRMYV